MTMTLEQVRDWHLARDREQRIVGFDLGAINHKGMADAIDANLTEIRAVIDELRIYDIPATNAAADKLTRALGNAQSVDVEKVRGLANQWRIRSDNMSGSASSQRLREDRDSYQRVAIKAESRLAAANALLRDIVGFRWFVTRAPFTTEEIHAHLQGAGDA